MSKSASLDGMKTAIVDYIKKNIPREPNHAKAGVISDGKVFIENQSFPYVSTIDEYISNGDRVYCIMPDSGNVAAIVGRG